MSYTQRGGCRIGIVVALLASNGALAGDFTPPAGPVGATMKSLETMEPRIPVGPDTTPGDANAVFVIGVPGSYYLTGDVNGEPGKDGIRIDVSDVALDLNGFAVRGVPTSGVGIEGAIGVRRLCMENGIVSGWGSIGIDGNQAFGSRLSNLVMEGNGAVGVYIGGETSVRDCRSRLNGEVGFFANGAVMFSECSAQGNGGNGFHAPGASTFVNCVSCQNTQNGFVVARGSLLNCNAGSNTISGFDLGVFGESVAATGCSAALNADGFVVRGACVLDHCVASANLTDGFNATGPALLVSCVAASNADDGFQLDGGAGATACQSANNAYGYFVPSESRTRIDSCSAITNTATGFFVNSARALVICNMARGNTTFDYFMNAGAQAGMITTAGGGISAGAWANFGSTMATAAPVEGALARKEAEAKAEREEFERQRATGVGNPTVATDPGASVP